MDSSEHNSNGGWRDPYAALRLRDFKLYVASGLMAVVGTQIQSVALGWELYSRTNDAMSLAWLGLVQVLPMLVLGLLAGQFSDWYDRKKILVVCQLISASCAFALFALTSQHDSSLIVIYLTVLMRSTATAFGRPARQALLPQIVQGPAFGNAITWNSSVFQIAFVVGPAIGGNLIHYGVPMAFIADALSTFGAAVSMSFVRHTAVQAPSKEPATLSTSFKGIEFVLRNKVLLAAMALDMFAVLLGGATALMPIYAKDILHVGPDGLGWLRSAPALGAIVMATRLAHMEPMKNAGRALLWAVAGYGAATIGFGLSTNFWLSLLMLFLTGALDNISVVVRHSLVQLLTPDEMRGRVSAVNSMFIGASNQLGEFESGVTAKFFGPLLSVIGGGIGTILVVIAARFLWPEIGRIGALHDVKPAQSDQKPTDPVLTDATTQKDENLASIKE